MHSECVPTLDLAGRSILIAGGSGFIGKCLLDYLAGQPPWLRPAAVCILARHPERLRTKMPEVFNALDIRLVAADVTKLDIPPEPFDYVIHAANDSGPGADVKPEELMMQIATGTRRMLDYALACGAHAFLLLSSGAIYGPMVEGVTCYSEDYPVAPLTTDASSAYAQAKRFAEQLTCSYYHRFGLPVRIARGFAFLGGHMRLDGQWAMGNFIKDALECDTVQVKGDAAVLRSYLYADDLARWLLTILIRGENCRPYNVGSDQVMDIVSIARLVAEVLAPGKPICLPENPAPSPRPCYVPDIHRARTELGLDVWTDLASAIRLTADRAVRNLKIPKDSPNIVKKPLTFVIDIDGVIATRTRNNYYSLARPIVRTIEAINNLHGHGHHIVLLTARGSATGLDWRMETERQLDAWGVKYHELHFGKPAADYYVDDKMMPLDRLIELAFMEAET